MKRLEVWRTQAETPPGRQTTKKIKRGASERRQEKEMLNITTVSVKY